MKHLFRTFIRSFFDLSTYRNQLTGSLRSSLGYFFSVYFALSLCLAGYLALFIAPPLFSALITDLDSLAATFPQQAQFTITDGVLTVDHLQDGPLIIPAAAAIGPREIDTFIFLDPSTSSPNSHHPQTFILATNKTLTFDFGSSTPQTFNWSDIAPDTAFNGQTLVAEAQNLAGVLQTGQYYIFPLLLLIVFIGLTFTRLINNAVYALIVNTVGLLIKRPYPYRVYFRLGLYVSVVAEVINLAHLAIYQSSFTNFFTLTYLGVFTIVLISLPKAIRIYKKT